MCIGLLVLFGLFLIGKGIKELFDGEIWDNDVSTPITREGAPFWFWLIIGMELAFGVSLVKIDLFFKFSNFISSYQDAWDYIFNAFTILMGALIILEFFKKRKP